MQWNTHDGLKLQLFSNTGADLPLGRWGERLAEQEAQLPLRNRASAMHFFVAKLLSIAVMTYSYVYHLRDIRLANLLRTQ